MVAPHGCASSTHRPWAGPARCPNCLRRSCRACLLGTPGTADQWASRSHSSHPGHQIGVVELSTERVPDPHGLAGKRQTAAVVDPGVLRNPDPVLHVAATIVSQPPPPGPTSVWSDHGFLL